MPSCSATTIRCWSRVGREVSRAANAELITAVPMGSLLPAVYQEDEFTMRWTQAMDSVLSTLITTLDCFDSYLDPTLSPPDFVEWVGSWVGVAVDPEWPEWRRRELVGQAARLFEGRGTAAGLRDLVRLNTGVDVDIIEGGATAASLQPGAALPGSDVGAFVVRLHCRRPPDIDHSRIVALVSANRPAHIPAVVEYAGLPASTGVT